MHLLSKSLLNGFSVIPFVSLRLFLLRQLTPALPVDVEWTAASCFLIVLPEQILQPVQQTGGCQKSRRVTKRVQMVEEKLDVDISLCGRCLQKQDSFFPDTAFPTGTVHTGYSDPLLP